MGLNLSNRQIAQELDLSVSDVQVMTQCHQDKVLLRRPLNIQSGFVSI
jgi:DNA-binding NarL/FixJ family response regulator